MAIFLKKITIFLHSNGIFWRASSVCSCMYMKIKSLTRLSFVRRNLCYEECRRWVTTQNLSLYKPKCTEIWCEKALIYPICAQYDPLWTQIWHPYWQKNSLLPRLINKTDNFSKCNRRTFAFSDLILMTDLWSLLNVMEQPLPSEKHWLSGTPRLDWQMVSWLRQVPRDSLWIHMKMFWNFALFFY